MSTLITQALTGKNSISAATRLFTNIYYKWRAKKVTGLKSYRGTVFWKSRTWELGKSPMKIWTWDASAPSVWEATLKEGKEWENSSVWQIAQELYWKTVATGLMEWRIQMSTANYHLESIWLETASFFSMTMTTNRVQMYQKHTWMKKHIEDLYQSWIAPPRAVCNHLNRELNKIQPTSKEGLWMSLRKPGELFLKTTSRNY